MSFYWFCRATAQDALQQEQQQLLLLSILLLLLLLLVLLQGNASIIAISTTELHVRINVTLESTSFAFTLQNIHTN